MISKFQVKSKRKRGCVFLCLFINTRWKQSSVSLIKIFLLQLVENRCNNNPVVLLCTNTWHIFFVHHLQTIINKCLNKEMMLYNRYFSNNPHYFNEPSDFEEVWILQYWCLAKKKMFMNKIRSKFIFVVKSILYW